MRVHWNAMLGPCFGNALQLSRFVSHRKEVMQKAKNKFQEILKSCTLAFCTLRPPLSGTAESCNISPKLEFLCLWQLTLHGWGRQKVMDKGFPHTYPSPKAPVHPVPAQGLRRRTMRSFSFPAKRDARPVLPTSTGRADVTAYAWPFTSPCGVRCPISSICSTCASRWKVLCRNEHFL